MKLRDLKPIKIPGSDTKRIGHGSWYRGLFSNFYPDKTQSRDLKKFLDIYIAELRPEQPLITKSTYVTAFGSCFAGYISRYLTELGINTGGRNLGIDSHIIRCGDGIVNTFSLRQQFEWAYANKDLSTELWFDTEGNIIKYTERARIVTKKIFDSTDVFILTLGLSEVCFLKDTGEVLWRAVPKKYFDAKKHSFRMSSVKENVENLKQVIKLINFARPKSHIVFTVSPIPLLASFRELPVTTASLFSKSVLLASVDEVLRTTNKENRVHYFPAYELVTQAFADPFVDDLRHPKPRVIAAVMDTFKKAYCQI